LFLVTHPNGAELMAQAFDAMYIERKIQSGMREVIETTKDPNYYDE
jgi:uncharacterized protein YaiI (UPF0178 family)